MGSGGHQRPVVIRARNNVTGQMGASLLARTELHLADH